MGLDFIDIITFSGAFIATLIVIAFWDHFFAKKEKEEEHKHEWSSLNFSSTTDACDCGDMQPNPDKTISESIDSSEPSVDESPTFLEAPKPIRDSVKSALNKNRKSVKKKGQEVQETWKKMIFGLFLLTIAFILFVPKRTRKTKLTLMQGGKIDRF